MTFCLQNYSIRPILTIRTSPSAYVESTPYEESVPNEAGEDDIDEVIEETDEVIEETDEVIEETDEVIEEIAEQGTSVSEREEVQADDLVKQGVSFLTGLADTLKSPERTRELVDRIVKTDDKTGETTLRIPVQDKQSVTNILSLFGSLFQSK